MKREKTNDAVPLNMAERFADQMGQLLGPDFPSDVAVAVSGGSDSMALLLLSHGWAHRMGVRLWVVTVDHGLRDESAAEAGFVARECAALGLPHAVLRWRGWDGRGNVQAAARAARYDLVDRWRGGVSHVLVGHTLDDLAETFLMRLARGSGVDGLAAMVATRWVQGRTQVADLEPLDVSGDVPSITETRAPGYSIVRPLLAETRAGLRDYLQFFKTDWCNDPSNLDPRYDRVKVRNALPQLAEIGLTQERLVDTAHRMAQARVALERRAYEVSQSCVTTCAVTGDVLFDRDVLASLDRETAQRLLAEALRVVSSSVYRPRSMALEDVLDRAVGGGTTTLQGCLISAKGNTLRVGREYNAIADHQSDAVGGVWDNRWHIVGTGLQGLVIATLGSHGIAQLPARPDNIPFTSLVTLPALFEGTTLVGCAVAGYGHPHQTLQNPPHGAFAAGWQPLKRAR